MHVIRLQVIEDPMCIVEVPIKAGYILAVHAK